MIPAGFPVKDNFPVPILEELKSFIRWYIASTEGSIYDSPTMRTVLAFAQQFVPGSYLLTGNQIPPQDSEELYFVRLLLFGSYSDSPLTTLVDPIRLDGGKCDQ